MQVGIRRCDDYRSGPARGQAGRVEAFRIDRIVPHNLAGEHGVQKSAKSRKIVE